MLAADGQDMKCHMVGSRGSSSCVCVFSVAIMRDSYSSIACLQARKARFAGKT